MDQMGQTLKESTDEDKTVDSEKKEAIAQEQMNLLLDALRGYLNSSENALIGLKEFNKKYEERGKIPSPKFWSQELVDLLLAALVSQDQELQENICLCLKILCRINMNCILVKDRGGIAIILKVIRDTKEATKIQQNGCGVLRNLAFEKVAKEGAVTTIIEVMNTHISHAGVQQSGCGALWNLSVSDEIISSIVQGGGIVCVLNAMKTHEDNLDVQECGTGVLWILSSTEQQKSMIIEAEGIKCILTAMSKYINDVSVQENAMGALMNLSSQDTAKEIIAREGGIEIIVRSMNTNKSSSVQQGGCGVLWNLALTEGNRNLITNAGGIRSILNSMRNHPANSTLQGNACGALWNIALDSMNMVGIAVEGGIGLIVTAMNTHKDSPFVQRTGCGALWNLSVNEENRTIIAKEGGIAAIIKSMSTHSSSPRIQKNACGALWNLAINEKNRIEIGESGGIECIVTALNNHRKLPDVQRYACSAMWNLSLYEVNKSVSVQRGVVEAVVNAMDTHKAGVEIQEHGVRILWNIITDPTLKPHAMNKEVKRVVATAMKLFKSNTTIERLGRQVAHEFEQAKKAKNETRKIDLECLEINETNREYIISVIEQGGHWAVPFLGVFSQVGEHAVEDHQHILQTCLLLTPEKNLYSELHPVQFENDEPFDIAALPTDMQLHVLSFLDPISLSRSATVCRLWNSLAQTNSMWRDHCRKFPYFRLIQLNAENRPWREIFMSECSAEYMCNIRKLCRKYHSNSLHSISMFRNPSVLDTLRIVHIHMINESKQFDSSRRLWADEVSELYDILFQWYKDGDEEIKQKLRNMFSFAVNNASDEHCAHLLNFFTQNSKSNHFNHMLETLCMQHGLVSGSPSIHCTLNSCFQQLMSLS